MACVASNFSLADTTTADTSVVENLWSDLRPSGYLKSYLILQPAQGHELLQNDTTWLSQSNLRLTWDDAGLWLKTPYAWEVHYELTPQVSNKVIDTHQRPTSDDYRLTDLPPNLTSASQHLTGQNLDRLNVQLRFDHGDVTLGRQAIAFGSARVISPTDVLLPFNVQVRNTEYRIGVDALRYQRPLGQLGEVDVGIIAGDDFQSSDSAVFVHIKTHVADYDLEFTALRFTNLSLMGAGLQTALGPAGFWFETVVVSGNDHYWRMSTGVDYALTDRLLGLVEYHYNGAGANTAEDYASLLTRPAYVQGGVFLMGQQYLMPGLSWQVSPLLIVAVQTVLNLTAHSAFMTLQIDYNLTGNIYLGFGVHGFSGESIVGLPPTLPEASASSSLGSEYGSVPDNVFVSFSVYF
jgi:opacity protein-like surface antigen